jgi:tRNA-2-methylthio-N6-dimethylallyladenosine synthase
LSKKLYIKTYGCQMNVYDSARMADVMVPVGYGLVENADDADLVILNTCHIREKAEEKVYSDLGRVRKARAKKEAAGEKMLIAVGGCVGQAVGEEIMKRAPYVDMVFGPQSYHNLPDMVMRAERDGGGVVDLNFAPQPKFDSLPEQTVTGASAFLSVQEGCDKFCTFCVVPYTRGAEYSRAPGEIEAEARRLVAQGALEITLLGQNVNAWHGAGEDAKDWPFAHLIRRLAEIKGLERIRYMTSHPRDMDDDLIAAHGDIEKLMPFLHLPVQSGSDSVLTRMNRKHKADFYLGLIHKLRKVRPDIAFSSDFIVGFPGETDLEFAGTLKLIETVGFAQAYSFAYSQRPGTPAATAGSQVPEEVKTERLKALQALITRHQVAFNQSGVGKVMPVLFDRKGKLEDQLLGKSPYMQSVHMRNASRYMGRIIDVVITGAHQNSLSGVVAEQNELELSFPRRRES